LKQDNMRADQYTKKANETAVHSVILAGGKHICCLLPSLALVSLSPFFGVMFSF